MPRSGSFTLAVAATLLVASAGPAPAAQTPPAPAAQPPAAAPAAAGTHATGAAYGEGTTPVDPKSDAALANYVKGLGGLKPIPDLYAMVAAQPDLDPLLTENTEDYDYIRYQVLTAGADWELFKATHRAVAADPALKARVGAAVK